jgi:hypothetical protein
MQVALRSHQPAEGAVLERVARASDKRLLEDEADPNLPGAARGCARYGEDRRCRDDS